MSSFTAIPLESLQVLGWAQIVYKVLGWVSLNMPAYEVHVDRACPTVSTLLMYRETQIDK